MLIGYRIDALPTGRHALLLTLWRHGVRPTTEHWTAFFHITPSANNAELVGQLDHAITDHQYPPAVWAAGEVVQENDLRCKSASGQLGSVDGNVHAVDPHARCCRSRAWRCG